MSRGKKSVLLEFEKESKEKIENQRKLAVDGTKDVGCIVKRALSRFVSYLRYTSIYQRSSNSAVTDRSIETVSCQPSNRIHFQQVEE